MIGHNNGPPIGDIADVGGRARLFYWRKAHKAAWRTPPIEIVKLRARAAEELGLSYKDYTSILMDRGRRPSAVLFDLGGTLVRTRNNEIDTDGSGTVIMMPGVRNKLQRLGECALFVITNQARIADGTLARETVEGYIRQISHICGVRLTDYSICGDTRGSQSSMRKPAPGMVTQLLGKHRIPPSQAIMVGDTVEDEKCAEAAKLARFFWAWHYFADTACAA